MTLPDGGIVLGVDIGFSEKRKTTVLAMLGWGDEQVGMACWRFPAALAERKKLLQGILVGKTAMCVALDGPIRGDMATIREYRDAEMMLTRGLAKYIGKPGQSNSGNGIRLNEATNEVARFLLGEGIVDDATHQARIMDKAIVEAFPTTFLGAMLDQKRIPKHGARSDAYFEHLLGPDSPRPRPPHGNRLADLIQRLLPAHVLMSDFARVTDHDARAAIVCAITALCVVAGQYVAVGDPRNGYIILPPRGLKGRLGLQDWAWKIIQGNGPDGSTDAIIIEPKDDEVDLQDTKQATPYQIDYMPWAKLNTEFSIGPVSFWPFNAKAFDKIADVKVREYLTRIFRSYVNHFGKPVESIVVCSIGGIDFRQLAEQERNLIRSAVDCLVFSTISNGTRSAVSANNNSMAPPTADRFVLYTRNFTVGREGFGIRSGGTLHYFTEMDEICIPEPFSMGGLFGHVSAQHIDAFRKVFEGGCPGGVRDRMFRALEWYRLAHTETEAGWGATLAHVVMMATAFEALLDFPPVGKRKHFVGYMEKEVATSEFKTGTRIDHRGKTHTMSLAGCWAWDFYDLRSRVVHGDAVDPNELGYADWHTYQIVADLVFQECLERVLYAHKCFGDEYRLMASQFAEAVGKAASPEADGLSTLSVFEFQHIHEALGWVPAREKGNAS